MRIALGTTSLSKYGGAASFQDHLAAQLRASGNEVTQYRIGREDATKGRIICVDKGVIKRKDEPFIAPQRLTCTWEDLWHRHDVVHITNPGSLHLGFDWDQLFATKHGPLVLTVHDPHEIEVLGPTLIKLCETADVVTFLSPHYMQHFVSAGYVDTPTMADKARFALQPYVRRKDPGELILKLRRVVCTSAWRPVKRIDLIVKAAAFLPVSRDPATTPGALTPEIRKGDKIMPLEFWSGDGVSYIEDMVENLPGMENCEDHGVWEVEEIGTVYGTAAAVVNMTCFDDTDWGRTEYPILEAWDYQVMPVLGTDFVGPEPELIGQLLPGVNCIAVEPEPEAIAAGIMQSIEKPVPMQNFAAALEPHTVAGARYLECYEEAVKRCGS